MENYEDEIKKACEVLRHGGVILYPTDTVWGIGCDATRSDAVRRVFEIKRRADSKALIILLGDRKYLDRYVDNVPQVADELMEASDRPVTIIYDRGINLAPEVTASDGSVAVRITSEDFSKRLCNALRRPLVSTSANISGTPAPSTFNEISEKVMEGVDYVVGCRRDDSRPSKPSIIIKISDDCRFKIIRK